VRLGAAPHLPDETARVYRHWAEGNADDIGIPKPEQTMPDETKPETEAAAKEAAAKKSDEVALELMKFIAVTTGYGKGNTTAAGFSGKASKSAEEYADALLQLFEKCRSVVARPVPGA
jgi:hypothetical protein